MNGHPVGCQCLGCWAAAVCPQPPWNAWTPPDPIGEKLDKLITAVEEQRLTIEEMRKLVERLAKGKDRK